MVDFVRARHDDVKGEAYIARDAFAFLPGWYEVPEDPYMPPEILDGTVPEVLAEVDGDPLKAAAALDAENARPKPRTTLVDALTAITAPTEEI